MNLLRLTLKDFQGASLVFEPNGQDATVRADNGKGKSRLFSAECWLLFGKDCLGRTDFDIKNLDAAGNQLHGLSHEVEGIYDIGGRPIILKKAYHEQYTQKRGTASDTFTGHTTDHFIDGVPVSKKEFDLRLEQIAPAWLRRLLSDPMYFNDDEAMKTKDNPGWKVRREMLLAACGGNIGDADVIATDRQLADLPAILRGRTPDDHRKIIAARRTEINKELQIIPARIDEANRALPDIYGLNRAIIVAALDGLRKTQADKQQEKARIESGGELAEQQRQLLLVNAKITNIMSQHRAAVTTAASAKQPELDKLNSRARGLQEDIDAKTKKVEANTSAIASAEQKLPLMRQQYQEINARQFEYNQATVCPTCEQPLPVERLQAARDKALAQFNTDRATQLEANKATVKATVAEIAKLKSENDTLQTEVDTLTAEKAAVDGQISAMQVEIDAINATATDMSGSTDYAAAVKERIAIENKISILNAADQAEAKRKLGAELNTSIQTRETAIRALNGNLAALDTHAKNLKRIAELEAQEKALAAEYERLERELNLLDLFTRKKVSMLDERINGKFEHARFKLFDVQVNGGINECCETLGPPNNVPWNGGLNYGHKIIVGLDIIRTFSRHYGLVVPIFVDNAESVTADYLPAMDAQVIRLEKPAIQTEEDRIKYSKLVVELEQPKLKEAM